MWNSHFLGPSSSPDVFNGTDEKIEKVSGAPPHEKIFFSYLVVVVKGSPVQMLRQNPESFIGRHLRCLEYPAGLYLN